MWEREQFTLTPALSRWRERETRHHLPLAGDGYSSPLSRWRERVRVREALTRQPMIQIDTNARLSASG
jgi:hypothetical protein